MTKATGFTVNMTFNKSTPGTHVYQDKSDGAKIPTLYIRKPAFGNGAPPTIEVTVGVPKE